VECEPPIPFKIRMRVDLFFYEITKMRYNLFLQTNAIFSFRQFSGGNIFSPVLTSPSSLCVVPRVYLWPAPKNILFDKGFYLFKKGHSFKKGLQCLVGHGSLFFMQKGL